MSEGLTALASENLNSSLRSLLEDVQRGHVRVPRFQRPFVWSDTQRIELLQSVRDNMPIGSLLVWRTVKYSLATFPSVGPHKIPAVGDSPTASGWQFLLDGHQRVSTLLGLLLTPFPSMADGTDEGETPVDWDIQYDLALQDFVFTKKASRTALRPLLPLWTLFDGRLANKHMREMRKQLEGKKFSETEFEEWEARADNLCYRFQQCRVPIVVMVTDDLGLAVKTFQRINSLGTPMGEAHLVSALTWSSRFDLRERLSAIRKRFPAGWRKIDDSLFLQVCKGLCGLDMTKSGQKELVESISSDPDLLDRAGLGLIRAIEFVEQELGIANPELLPYSFQLICFAVELARENSAIQPTYSSWFWRTGWSEIFSSASYREVKSEQENLRYPKALTPWDRPEPIPARFDFRLARARLFLLRLVLKAEVVSTTDGKIDCRMLIANHGRDAFVRLFPTPRNATPSLKRLLQGAGNRFLIEPKSEDSFREELLGNGTISAEVLRSHFIDDNALITLRLNDLESFIFRRAQAMEAWDKQQWDYESECAFESDD
jgi:hypothetical protein